MALKLLSQSHNVSPQHTPGSSAWSQLVAALQSYASLHDIYLNNLGENAPYSPLAAAQLVKGGAVWIDWCGWPFYASGGGATGFKNFLNYAGLASPSGMTFDTGSIYGDPYPRGLVSSASLNSNFKVNGAAPNGSDGAGNYYASSFAVKMGKGLYIYAFGNDGTGFGPFGAGSSGGEGVPVSRFSPFVVSQLSTLPDLSGPESNGPPGCTQYGTFLKNGDATGTYEFVQYGNGQAVYNIVDFNCHLIASYTHSNPGTPLPSGGGSGGNYPPATAQVNGKPFAAIMYGSSFTTCLLYTCLNEWGIDYTVDYTNHIFTLSNGTKIQGIVSNGTTYLPWNQIPGVKATPLQGGGHNFTFSGLPSKSGGATGSHGANGTMGLVLAAAGIVGGYYMLKKMAGGR